jgi:hypothetical protein
VPEGGVRFIAPAGGWPEGGVPFIPKGRSEGGVPFIPGGVPFITPEGGVRFCMSVVLKGGRSLLPVSVLPEDGA